MHGLPIRDYEAAFGQTTTLVLAPHPDDESLGCGGLIAQACANGRPPLVVILTDGAQSHPNSNQFPRDRLRGLREQEARDATAALGLPAERLVFLRYPDSAAPTAGPELQRAAAEVTELVHSADCHNIAVSWGLDPHCDHAAAASIAAAACAQTGARLLAYPIWAWTLPPEHKFPISDIRGFRLDIGACVENKRTAIMAHGSQYAGIITDDPDGFQLPEDFIDRFLTRAEVYLELDAA
jgi:LmbE family N-acetylglucosaminyl deacetylase